MEARNKLSSVETMKWHKQEGNIAKISYRIKRPTLSEARIICGLSIEDVCKSLHIKQSTLKNWENYKTSPSMTNSVKLSNLYGIPNDLITWVNNPGTVILTVAELTKRSGNYGLSADYLIEKYSIE